MPQDYEKRHLGQLISAIWSKYLSLEGGDINTQKLILAKDREIFQKDKEIEELKYNLKEFKNKNSNATMYEEFEEIFKSKRLDEFISERNAILNSPTFHGPSFSGVSNARAFGLIEESKKDASRFSLSLKGREFFQWYLLNYG